MTQSRGHKGDHLTWKLEMSHSHGRVKVKWQERTRSSAQARDHVTRGRYVSRNRAEGCPALRSRTRDQTQPAARNRRRSECPRLQQNYSSAFGRLGWARGDRRETDRSGLWSIGGELPTSNFTSSGGHEKLNSLPEDVDGQRCRYVTPSIHPATYQSGTLPTMATTKLPSSSSSPTVPWDAINPSAEVRTSPTRS